MNVNFEQIYNFFNESDFFKEILAIDNNIGTNLLTSGILEFLDGIVLALSPSKEHFIQKNKKKRLEFLNDKFVNYGTDKLIEFYKETDLGHEEDAVRKTQELIKKIDTTLDLKTSENSITFFTGVLIFKILEPKLLANENNKEHLQETKQLFQVFEASLFIATSINPVNFFTKRKRIRQQKKLFDTIRNYNYSDYRNKLLSILFQNEYSLFDHDFFNYTEFRENTSVGYIKKKEDFRYQYLKHLTQILDNFKFYLQQQIAPSKPDEFKLKVNISVDELCLLFKELNNLTINIFETKHNTELFRFISENFITKGTNDISHYSVKNIFYKEPEVKTVDFWKTHISTIQRNLRKY